MRYYSSTAGAPTLSSSIASGVTSFAVTSVSGFPTSYPFTVVIDPGLASEEIVTVTNVAGTTLTVTRGEDGSSAQSHSLGATVRHMVTARDLREPQEHIAATEDIHGTGSGNAVVGTGTTQTLTNKSISGATNTLTNIAAASVTGLAAHLAASTGVHGVTGSVVGTTDTQTLTNKTISGASNTLSAIPSSAVTGLDSHTGSTAAHGATGAVVGTTNTQTLTNKTISGASNTLSNIAQSSVTNLTADLSTLTTATGKVFQVVASYANLPSHTEGLRVSTSDTDNVYISDGSAWHQIPNTIAATENLALNGTLYQSFGAGARNYPTTAHVSKHRSGTAALNGIVENLTSLTMTAGTEYQLTTTAFAAAYRPSASRIFYCASSHGPFSIIVENTGHVFAVSWDGFSGVAAYNWYVSLDNCRWDI